MVVICIYLSLVDGLIRGGGSGYIEGRDGPVCVFDGFVALSLFFFLKKKLTV